MSDRLTIKKLAETLNLSIFTVSAALADNPRVAEATRRKVHAYAAAHGYRRDNAARRMRRHCSETIALIIDDLKPGYRKWNEFGEFGVQRDWLFSITECVRQHGFDLRLLPVGERIPPEELQRYLGYPEADGVIFFGMCYTKELFEAVRKSGLPQISIKPRCPGLEVTTSYVDVISENAVRQAMRYLLERGHRRIAYSNFSDLAEDWLRERYIGYELELKAAGLFDPALIVQVSDRIAIRKLVNDLKTKRDYTAVLCQNDFVAWNWILELRYAGLRVPEDFAVVGYDGVSGFPGLTTIDAKQYEVGWSAAEELISAISEKRRPETKLLNAEFVVGKTT